MPREIKKIDTVKGKAMFIANPSGVIQMNSTPISLIQRKCWLLLLYNAFPNLTKKKRHTISINELCIALGYNDTMQLKNALEDLVTSRIEFNILKSKDHNVWQVMTLLSVAMIKDNVLTYGYVEELLEKLIDNPIYTKIKIEIVKMMTSKHSLALYELACDHLLPNGKGVTPDIPLSELSKLFGCQGNKAYNNFKYFNRNILKKAVAEVNAKTDIVIDVKLKQAGKKIHAVQFCISEKKDKSAMLHTLAAIPEIPEMPETTPVEVPAKDDTLLYEQLTTEYDLTPRQTRQIFEKYDRDHIKERMDWVVQNYRNAPDKVKNLGALTQWAITCENIEKTTDAAAAKAISLLPKIVSGMRVNIGGGTVVIADENGYFYNEKHLAFPTQKIRIGIQDGRFQVEHEQ